jgi:hypothetical protein
MYLKQTLITILIVLIETLAPTHAETLVCKSQLTETQAKASVENFSRSQPPVGNACFGSPPSL